MSIFPNMNTLLDKDLREIILKLPLVDLLSYCSTNKRIRDQCQTEELWRLKLTQDFPRITKKKSFTNKEWYKKLLSDLVILDNYLPKPLLTDIDNILDLLDQDVDILLLYPRVPISIGTLDGLKFLNMGVLATFQGTDLQGTPYFHLIPIQEYTRDLQNKGPIDVKKLNIELSQFPTITLDDLKKELQEYLAKDYLAIPMESYTLRKITVPPYHKLVDDPRLLDDGILVNDITI